MLKLAIYAFVPFLVGLLGFIGTINRRWQVPFVKRLPFLVAYLIVATFLSPTVIIHIALCSIAVPLFARKREEVVPIYLFALLLVPSVGYTLNVGSVRLLPITGFATLGIGALVWSLVHGKRDYGKKSYIAGLSILLLFTVIVFIGARDTTFTNLLRVIFDVSLSLLMPFFIVRRCIKSVLDVRLAMIAMIAATASLSASAIYEANAHWPLFRSVYDHYGIVLGQGSAVKLRGGFVRSAGPFIEPTSFAFWLTLGTGALLASPWLFRSKVKSGLLLMFLLVGLFAPQSRGAWLGLIALYAIFQMVNGKSTSLLKPALFTLATATTIYGAGLFIPRVGNMLGLNDMGVVQRDYRQDLLSRGLEESKNHLIIGNNNEGVRYALRDMVQGEGFVDFVNSYIFILLLSGLIGLAMFALALLSPIRALLKVRKRVPVDELAAISFVIAALGAVVIMIAFTSLGGRTNTAIVMLLGLSGGLLNARRTTKGGSVVAERAASSRRDGAIRIGGPPTPDNPIIHSNA